MAIRIGIVDDKPFLRESLKARLLNESGIEVQILACDGEEFLVKMKESAVLPDVVFMDIEMPRMDGIKTITIAKEIYPSVKFLVLTVFDDDDKLLRAIKAGATGYLLKNQDIECFVRSITDAEDGGAPISPKMAKKALELMSEAVFPKKNNTTENPSDFRLTAREMDILQLLVEGLNYNQASERLFISPRTVRTHIQNVYAKLHVSNKTAAVKIAIKKGWFKNMLSDF